MDLGLATRRRASILSREIYDLTQAMVKVGQMLRENSEPKAKPHYIARISNVFERVPWLPCGCAPPKLFLDTCGIHGLPEYRRTDEGH